MKEYVGICTVCQKDVYCLEGFLNGVVVEGKLVCFACEEEEKRDSHKNKNWLPWVASFLFTAHSLFQLASSTR